MRSTALCCKDTEGYALVPGVNNCCIVLYDIQGLMKGERPYNQVLGILIKDDHDQCDSGNYKVFLSSISVHGVLAGIV